MKRRTFLSLMGAAALTSSMMLTGCGVGSGDDRKICLLYTSKYQSPV